MGVAEIDGRIYAAGGFRGGESVRDFAVYDPGSDTWTALPPMPTARNHLAAAAIGGRFYAVGGRDGNALFGRLEAFDLATGRWLTGLAPMPTPRGGLMAAALGGRLFTFGGEGNPAIPLGVFPQTEAYDPGADRWARLAPMPNPRHGTTAVPVADAIYLPGGASREGFGTTGANDAFVPSSGSVFEVKDARLRGGRLRLRGRIPEPPEDPADAPLGLRLVDDERELVSLALPAGSLEPTRRGFRYRDASAGADFTRIALVRRRGGGLGVRIGARVALAGDIPSEAAVVLELGGATFCGPVRFRAALPAR